MIPAENGLQNQKTWTTIAKRVLLIAAGIALIAAGVLGLVLPIVPGWVLILVGILLLGPKTRVALWLKRICAKLRAKFS